MDSETWNALLISLPQSHILQTWQWAKIKSDFGWKPAPTAWRDRQGNLTALAMVLERGLGMSRFSSKLRVMYVPRGPILKDWSEMGLRQQVLIDLRNLARKRRAIFIKIDPEVVIGKGIDGTPNAWTDPLGNEVVLQLKQNGWRFSDEQVQFRNTVMIDLKQSEDDLLAHMKQKTRYNLRLAGRKGVTIRSGSTGDLDMLFHMYAETSLRNGFVIRESNYYHQLWNTFMQAGMLEPLIAEVDHDAVAALMLFHFNGKAWFLHGMSREAHREKMPNYLLQWEAIRRAKDLGCGEYDLWGAPDIFNQADQLWSVYRFKEGFGGEVVRTIGAWDLPINPLYYWLYTRILPKILELMRRRGMTQTKETLAV